MNSFKVQFLVLSLILISGCSFMVVDTRTPEQALATQEAKVLEVTATEVVMEATLVATPAPECLIKGNINSRGERIFHIPGGSSYDRTVIDPEHGEAFFCSEGEAVHAGFRKALR